MGREAVHWIILEFDLTNVHNRFLGLDSWISDFQASIYPIRDHNWTGYTMDASIYCQSSVSSHKRVDALHHRAQWPLTFISLLAWQQLRHICHHGWQIGRCGRLR